MTIFSEQGQLIPDSALYPSPSVPFDGSESGNVQTIPSAEFGSQWYSTSAHYANLCWACCAQMVQQILTRTSQTLDVIVSEVMPGCSSAAACDSVCDPAVAYHALHIGFSQSPSDPTVSAGALKIDQVINLLTSGNGPVQYRIAWGPTAHTALIVGYFEDDRDVYIMDPIYGEGPLNFDLLAGGYWGNGSWTYSWYGFRAQQNG
jgi:hypothetical protein